MVHIAKRHENTKSYERHTEVNIWAPKSAFHFISFHFLLGFYEMEWLRWCGSAVMISCHLETGHSLTSFSSFFFSFRFEWFNLWLQQNRTTLIACRNGTWHVIKNRRYDYYRIGYLLSCQLCMSAEPATLAYLVHLWSPLMLLINHPIWSAHIPSLGR